ncbi:MAG TPA: N-6 DNA methylase, partial [Phycisphaerae bacterium]|nr:N-6 DNA methylase [Phycisphaerae bacterium]
GDGHFESEPGLGHIFRRGEDKDEKGKCWRVEGVYGLRDTNKSPERFVPIVYVCQADDESAAHELHKKVWNQDIVPYVLVRDPKGVRVYAGFHYDAKGKTNPQRGIIHALTDFDHVESIIKLFEASAIDEGKIWQNPLLQVDPSRRVYHQLLRNLSELDKWLRGTGKLKKEVSHALIGKYVYLRYLRDRDILSNERLTEMWDIQETDIFSRNATKAALEKLTDKLEDWLNGEIFPLSLSGANAPTSDHVKRVAATFAGDEIGDKKWQTHLDFKAYDFSYIPIETLSLIYEQFLHAEDEGAQKKKKKTKGRKAGAYYTPLPLVNFMLAELHGRRSLKEGMKVCDPSSGSGAFLVQAYRRLIENTFNTKKPVKASELKRILQTSIFGVDLDGDACRVTELSLLLTLLDYVDPPDLTGKNSTFKLPSLHNKNIFEGNFFEVEPQLQAAVGKNGFDWIIGNPPWKQLKGSEHEGHDQPAWDWMEANTINSPVSMNQVCEFGSRLTTANAAMKPCANRPNRKCAFMRADLNKNWMISSEKTWIVCIV